MSARLLFTCVLSVITATGCSLSCYHCAVKDEEVKDYHMCEGKTVQCSSPDDVCVSVYERTTVGASLGTTLFIRLCGKCDQYRNGTVRFHKGRLRVNTTCCHQDDCTPPIPTLPPDKFSKNEKIVGNGIKCKTCYATNSKACDCTSFMNCTKDETKCISRSAIATEPVYYSMAMRGCTTEEMCPNKNQTLSFEKLKYDFLCTDESDGIHDSLLPLVLTTSLVAILHLHFAY
ncbi:phospholipase A2 inhibitor gamma subunit B-like [Pseudophryne corroboree]|uniref:phospholipase A2 inhibitor gamma subunit B-like n=1 Tax=Pseudophryne corroboree TaxID=495146 RepID=UPI003081D032